MTAQPYKFDESVPALFCIPARTKQVWFHNESSLGLDRAELRKAILGDPLRSEIERIDIGWSSQITCPWIASLFPNVRTVWLSAKRLESLQGLEAVPKLAELHVDTGRSSRRSLALLPKLQLRSLYLHISKRTDVDHVAQCNPLEWFGFSAWPFPDMAALCPLVIHGLNMSGGLAKTMEGLNDRPMDRVQLKICRKLQSVAGLQTVHLSITACQDIQLDTVGEVVGLRDLWLFDQKQLPSVRFLSVCERLDSLVIGSNTPTLRTDWTPVIDHARLRYALLPRTVPDVTIRELAMANQRLTISNGRIFFFRGESVSEKDWFLLSREMTGPGENGNDLAVGG